MLKVRGRLARHLVTALCVIAVLLPATASVAADPEKELEDVRQQLLETHESLEDIDERRTVTLADLQRADSEIARLDANLAALRTALGGAQQELEEAEQRLANTTATLVATQERLDRTRAELDHERDVFAGRTRASFMFGGTTSLAGASIDAGDIAQFGRALVYVERVMAADRDRVTRIHGLAREIEADTVELGVLQDRQVTDRAAAESERNRVAGLVAEEQELRDVAAHEREKRQVVLAQLDADRGTHLEMVADLEAEGERIEAELRRIAEEERRRQEEERRRQEEERRQERERALASRSQNATAQAPAASGGGAAAEQPPASTGRFQRPAGGRLTSSYGWRTHPIFGTRRFHAGADFGGGHGAPIYAAEAGVVLSAGNRGGYGMTIVIDHGGGLSTLYAHQSRFAVSAGQRVARGQVIGYIGSTGYSTGPHLHFEVRVNGATRDPLGYL